MGHSLKANSDDGQRPRYRPYLFITMHIKVNLIYVCTHSGCSFTV